MESMGVVVRRYIDFNSIPTFCPFFSVFRSCYVIIWSRLTEPTLTKYMLFVDSMKIRDVEIREMLQPSIWVHKYVAQILQPRSLCS